MHELKGKAVLITGAAKRIGRHIALAFAKAGADVAITYLSSERQAQQTLVDMAGGGGRTLAVRCDVSDEASVKAAVREVVKEFGGLDVLVNNAGLYETVDLDQISPEQWDRMFAANARGPFLVAKAALRPLRRRRGRIINIGSLGGERAWTEHGHYCASKAALSMLTKVMAKAWAPQVAVNCVSPGMIDMTGKEPNSFVRKVAKKTPMKRAGRAGDVVEVVQYLATATHFLTGQTIVVDGGLGLAS